MSLRFVATLSGNPGLGRLCDDVRPGLRLLEHGKHVVFYRQERGGILVSRILHQRMLPELHSIEDLDAWQRENFVRVARKIKRLCEEKSVVLEKPKSSWGTTGEQLFPNKTGFARTRASRPP